MSCHEASQVPDMKDLSTQTTPMSCPSEKELKREKEVEKLLSKSNIANKGKK